MMRVLADTNGLISYLLSPDAPAGTIRAFVEAAFAGEFALLLPEELLDERGATPARKPYLVARISVAEAAAFVGALRAAAILLPPLDRPVPPVVRDPKDDYLLAQAVLAPADYLVTGDADLLALGDAAAPLRIVCPATFVQDVLQAP